jgi:regulatory protein
VTDDQVLIARVVDALAAEQLQSDERHAFSYARQRAGRGYGPVRIAQELRERGVDKMLCQHALEAAEADWLSAAKAARLKRFGRATPANAPALAAQMRFLHYRGFPPEIVRRCFAAIGAASADMAED